MKKQDYETLWQKKIATRRSRLSERETLAVQLVQKGDYLLDLGCGDGMLVATLQNQFQFTCGIELAESAALAASQHGVNVVRADLNAFHFPFQNGSFSCIVTLDVIEHVMDPDMLIQEICRLLKPGGILILSTPNIRQIFRIYTIMVKGRFPKTSGDEFGWDGGHVHYFTVKDIRRLLSNYGMTILAVRGIMALGRFERIKRCIYKILPKYWVREFISPGFIIKAQKGNGS